MGTRARRGDRGEPPEWRRITPEAITLDGDRVVYRAAGRGPVLLLVHGLAGSAATWKRVMTALARSFTVIAPDLLGQGESDKPRAEYSLGTHANTVRDLLHALGHDGATIVGQSLGGGVALQLAYQFPELCERLVLVASGGLGSEVSVVLRALTLPGARPLLALASAATAHRTVRWIGERIEAAGVRPTCAQEEMLRSYVSLATPEARRAFFRSVRGVVDWSGQAIATEGHLDVLRSIPTMVMWGSRDPFIPVAHAHAAESAIPGSRVVIFDGVGHYPHCEAPAAFVDAVTSFVRSTAPAHLPPRHFRRRIAGERRAHVIGREG